jgi:hypothetical protein
MVQAIENWADLSGTVREVRPRPGVSQMNELVLEVEQADDVEGFPNLLVEAPGSEVAVAIEAATLQAAGVEPGAKVRCRAQRAAPNVVVGHPEGLRKA